MVRSGEVDDRKKAGRYALVGAGKNALVKAGGGRKEPNDELPLSDQYQLKTIISSPECKTVYFKNQPFELKAFEVWRGHTYRK